jgi:hypothetical protein
MGTLGILIVLGFAAVVLTGAAMRVLTFVLGA